MDIASALLNSSGGGLGSGASVKVQRAVGLKRGEVSGLPKTDRSRYLGLFRVGSSGSSNGFPALLSFMTWFSTLVAHVVSSTVLFLFATLSVIPHIARLVLLPVFAVFCSLSWSFLTLGGSGADCHPNRIHVRDPEVGKLFEG